MASKISIIGIDNRSNLKYRKRLSIIFLSHIAQPYKKRSKNSYIHVCNWSIFGCCQSLIANVGKSAAEKRSVVEFVLFKVRKMLPVSNFKNFSDGKKSESGAFCSWSIFFCCCHKAGFKVSLQTAKSAAEKRAVVEDHPVPGQEDVLRLQLLDVLGRKEVRVGTIREKFHRWKTREALDFLYILAWMEVKSLSPAGTSFASRRSRTWCSRAARGRGPMMLGIRATRDPFHKQNQHLKMCAFRFWKESFAIAKLTRNGGL